MVGELHSQSCAKAVVQIWRLKLSHMRANVLSCIFDFEVLIAICLFNRTSITGVCPFKARYWADILHVSPWATHRRTGARSFTGGCSACHLSTNRCTRLIASIQKFPWRTLHQHLPRRPPPSTSQASERTVKFQCVFLSKVLATIRRGIITDLVTSMLNPNFAFAMLNLWFTSS